MVKIPEYESQQGLNPTPLDPKTAATQGGNVVDISQGLSGLGQTMQKLQDKTETLKAETALAVAHQEMYKLAATDPDVFGLEEKVSTNTTKYIQQAADLIKSQSQRNLFIEKASLEMERRNTPIYNMIYRRQSQDFKGTLLSANDQDIKEYQSLADPAERQLVRQKIVDRTNTAIKDGYVHSDWARTYLKNTLKQADVDQVKNDMAIDAEATYRELQKGKEGLYPDISEGQRKQFFGQAQKMIAKQGAEKNYIASIAQNHAENQLIDKMGSGALTQEDVNNAQLMGIKGVKIRPEFAKAATEALQDPFPTDSDSAKYTRLFDDVTNPDKDPLDTKLSVMKSRGITPAQKAHLINSALREDAPGEGKHSLDQLIQDGVQKNKQEIMELNHKIEKEVKDKRSILGRIGSMFSDHAKDDAHLASLQQQLMEKVSQSRKTEEMLGMAKEIINKDTLARNPKISTADQKGTVFMDKTTGVKRIYYPDGHWEPLKNGR